jgi:hypothetical protein
MNSKTPRTDADTIVICGVGYVKAAKAGQLETELAEANRAWEIDRNSWEQAEHKINALIKKRDQLLATNRELVKDKERLDWLNDHFHLFEHCVLDNDDDSDPDNYGEYDACYFKINGEHSDSSPHIRTALDAAINQKEGV